MYCRGMGVTIGMYILVLVLVLVCTGMYVLVLVLVLYCTVQYEHY